MTGKCTQCYAPDITMPLGGHPNQEMHTYSTGAKRSKRMPRYDLIPAVAITRLAERFTGDLAADGKTPLGGALKYGEGNWEKGLPTSDVINHVIGHLLAYQDCFRNNLYLGIIKGFEGKELMEFVKQQMRAFTAHDDELAGAMWGISVLMHQEDTEMFHDDKFKINK